MSGTIAPTGTLEPKYLNFKKLPDGALNEDGEPALNRYSSALTRGHEAPGAQVRRTDIPRATWWHPDDVSLGDALRCWRPEQARHEECSSSRHCICLVGRESLQVMLAMFC